ncbi:MAG: hypothetical protein AMXMBFR84_19840 [Candidatus Hydrogenedentota bacterium]
MDIKLGINTGFAINRFPEPDDWLGVVADDLGLDTVQFTADLLNPFLPEDKVAKEIEKIRSLCNKKGVTVESTFTSAFTRVNHLMHPDPELQAIWVEWFKRFFRLSRDLGAEGAGSHFGIMSVRDNADPEIREKRIQQGVDNWRRLAEYGASIGLRYLLFEPMSIPRECAETIAATEDILRRCGIGFAIPMLLCQDVDHGDLQSTNPDDTNPHAWLRAFGLKSPCIHIKQSLLDKGGHYPFTPEYNERGKIIPNEIIDTLKSVGVAKTTLLLEISHRERYPADYRVVADLKASVSYWKPAIEAARAEAEATV